MIRILLPLFLALVCAGPAQAHRLKVFAAVAGGEVSGYAFFIGGGRPQGAAWVARDGNGKLLAEGETDAQGGFRFALPDQVGTGLTVTVDTHEAHIASATLPAARLGAPAAAAPPPAATAAPPPPEGPQVAELVDAAVQRQVEPLLERIEAMDSRLRFVDILSGIFLIIGLAGMTLWLRARRG